jgi:hypothetical protein
MSQNIEPLSLLILSDIHFGRLAFSEDFALKNNPPPHKITNAVPMKRNLIDTLSGENIEAILVTGDLTSTGGPSEFQACHDCVIEIAEGWASFKDFDTAWDEIFTLYCLLCALANESRLQLLRLTS